VGTSPRREIFKKNLFLFDVLLRGVSRRRQSLPIIASSHIRRDCKAAIPVAWTFLSETLAKQPGIVERLSIDDNLSFDSVSRPTRRT